MSRLKHVLRLGGVVVAVIGLMCLPIGFRVSPKRDLSLFNNLADTGAFIATALVLIPVGLITIVLSYILPGELGE